ncbi:MAG: translation initiation factor IF-2, partial [Eubacteriales bacterium]|nr:translation initiation factor IF-2 [Eubacteriales bacterium]
MANKTMDSAREFETQAKELLERVKRMQNDLGAALQSVKRAESELIDKEKRAEKERMEKERAERLREVLTSEGDLAFHVGDDRADEQPAPAESKVEINEEPKPEPVKEQKVEETVQAKVEEPAMADKKPEEKPEIKAESAPVNRPAQQQRPAYERRESQRREDSRPQKPRTDRPQQRPMQGGYQPKPAARTMESPVPSGRDQGKNRNQKPQTRDEERKAPKNKKTIMKENTRAAGGWDDDAPMSRKQKRKQQAVHKPEPVKIDKAVLTTETITVKDLSEKIGKPAAEIIKKLFILGIMATINQEIDYDTCSLIAADYGIELELNIAKTAEDVLNESVEEADSEENLVPRPPVVTIMGHVDHGKTSLLDAFRESSITEGEAGGITQHIGAYTVPCKGRTITFIDTPGHEAFTSMRARGAQVTDIVILVVAADDGIMPQTVEAINHAKAAEVPIIVAINKIDKDTANPDRVIQQLTEYGLVAEEWGGDTICVPVSAKKRINLDTLLEMVLLQADVLELKANPDRAARGTIIEAELDKGRGPVATVLVQNGTLKIGDPIVAGTAFGRVRAMMDDKGRRVTSAGPSQPVEVLGFGEVPSAGDVMNVAEVDKLSRQVAEERRDKLKAEQIRNMSKVSLDDLFSQIEAGNVKDL